MDLTKILNILPDLELVLKDPSNTLTLNLHKVILVTTCPYFDRLLSFKDLNVLTLEVSDAVIARDLILSFYNIPIISTNCLYVLGMIKCRDYFGLHVEMPNIKVPAEFFELFLEVCEIVGFDGNVIKMINANVPEDYDLALLSKDLIQEMINAGYSHRIISGSFDQRLKIWDEKGDLIATSPNNNSAVSAIATTHDQTRIIFGIANGKINIMDAEGEILNVLDSGHNHKINTLIISSNDKYLVSAINRYIHIWDIANASLIKTLREENTNICFVKFMSNDTKIISGNNYKITLWDIETATIIKQLNDYSNNISCMALTTDNSKAVIGSLTHTIKIWDLEKNLVINTIVDASIVRSLIISPDSTQIISAGVGIKIWDIKTATLVKSFGDFCGMIWSITLLDSELICGNVDGNIRIWDLQEGTLVKSLRGHIGIVSCIITILHETPLTRKLLRILDKN